MLNICTKFREIISNVIEVIEWTRFLYQKLQREITPQNVGRATIVISARRLVMLHIFAKFRQIISNGIKVIEWTQFLY